MLAGRLDYGLWIFPKLSLEIIVAKKKTKKPEWRENLQEEFEKFLESFQNMAQDDFDEMMSEITEEQAATLLSKHKLPKKLQTWGTREFIEYLKSK